MVPQCQHQSWISHPIQISVFYQAQSVTATASRIQDLDGQRRLRVLRMSDEMAPRLSRYGQGVIFQVFRTHFKVAAPHSLIALSKPMQSTDYGSGIRAIAGPLEMML
ncbi:hypothetical protein BS47DRAFT_1403231 [Hydnum rufescens UP504]|uniref:Uncharacterized protein n=1 Tax=Hydnum rufescens UP504 TaxID=1448309 RepID=A0A9P6ACP0_9AGAM|nr:hypothetical protein BS47DRAFT_1403231 [Hydnum rufescens UP504]